MPETKAINSAMTSFLFIAMKFDLQSNAFFSEKLHLCTTFCDAEGLASQSPASRVN